MAVLDKKICEALSYADEVVDAKKDDTIEGLVSAKKVIHNLGPVQSAVVSRMNDIIQYHTVPIYVILFRSLYNRMRSYLSCGG